MKKTSTCGKTFFIERVSHKSDEMSLYRGSTGKQILVYNLNLQIPIGVLVVDKHEKIIEVIA